MLKLNLPEFEVNLKKSEGKIWIFDGIRKKYLVLTPEEWVRQHLINYFIQYLKYPKSLISVERGLTYNQLQKRSDIVVFDRSGNPWMIVECKSPEVELDQKSVMQVAVYNTDTKAKYVSVSNGLKHICYETKAEVKDVVLLKDFPVYE
ncbi:MAG: type I restriction enzyme HsdR N-terminal domain-containing protein [Cyclobacteriaceae bacterium]